MAEELRGKIDDMTRMLIKALGEDFSIQSLIDFTSAKRNKKVIIIQKLIHPVHLGMCLSFRNCDLIVIAPNLGQKLYILTVIHELVHLLRGVLLIHYDRDYDDELHHSITFFHGLRKSADNFYEDCTNEVQIEEKITDGVARRLVKNALKHEASVPDLIQRFYGYKEKG